MKALAIGCLCALAMTGQTCAKHVRLHSYYNTSAQPLTLSPLYARIPPSNACGPTPDVGLWFDAVPEWLNGDATLASADMTRAVQIDLGGVRVPTLAAYFLAYGYTGNTGTAYDAYFLYACSRPVVYSGGWTWHVCVTPSSPTERPNGLYDVLYSWQDAVTGTTCEDSAEIVFPSPANDPRAGRTERAYFLPRFSSDQLDPCEWTCPGVVGCGPDSLSQTCLEGDPVHIDVGVSECLAPTPYGMLYESRCCSCPVS